MWMIMASKEGAMEIILKDASKTIEIWLTNVESNDDKLRHSLQPIYKEYAQKKYKIAVFESGHGDLFDKTRDLLLSNLRKSI